ncbi:MAG: type II toxin-antitoxin system VapC family toxin [Verrucomicrobia bacterium]|nr:type II toxin-antitoxin system VapC family toxin [Verrucomicrobiota bacterium]
MIHFDTSFLIAVTVPGSAAYERLRAWANTGENVGVSAIAWAEYLCGPLDATADAIARQMFPQPEPFLAEDAVLAAQLFNKTGRRSRSMADCMIAAVAIRCNAGLATVNTADFKSFEPFGLKLK